MLRLRMISAPDWPLQARHAGGLPEQPHERSSPLMSLPVSCVRSEARH